MNRWPSVEISKNVHIATFPLFYLSRICGLAPLSINSYSSGFILKLSVKYTIYSFVLASALFSFSMYNLIKVIQGDVSKYVISIETTIAVQLNVLVGIFGYLFRLPRLFAYLNCIKEIDMVIPIKNAVSTRTLSIRTLIIVMGTQTIFMAFDLAMGAISGLSHNEKSNSQNFLAHYLSYYVVLTVTFQYAHMVNAIERRITQLNTHLSLNCVLCEVDVEQPFSILRTVSNPKTLQCISKDTVDKMNRFSGTYLEEMTMVYLKLCDAVNAVNDCFGFTILVIIMTCLVQLTVHLYFVLSNVVKQADIARITMESLWLLVHFCRLIIIVEPCNRCLVKVKTLKASVGKLQCSKIGIKYEDQLSLLCAHLYSYTIKFSAFGLGSIDRSLITSFAGAVATYLVIIIQFETPN